MKNFRYITILILAALSLSSCKLKCDCGEVVLPESYDKVMIMYSAGVNDLSSDLKEDIEDLCSGFVPGICSGDALVFISHFKSGAGVPVIESVYTNLRGKVVRDTLKVFPGGSRLTDKETMREALMIVDDTFKASRYGMVYSSHATGWLPPGFYDNPNLWKSGSASLLPRPDGAVPYVEPVYSEGEMRVKSIGQTAVGALSYEMELTDFAEALPIHLDYLIFDACLMGGIETAYELRNHCDLIGFSQTEILSEGMNYKTMGERLLKAKDPDVLGVCQDYFDYYNAQTGVMKSATVSLIDCRKLEPLAQVCRQLFIDNRPALDKLTRRKVQGYFRSDRKWFYDLQDILVKCILSLDETDMLQEALDGCVIYKAATPSFMLDQKGFEIETYCGFSMYLPNEGTTRLDNAYRRLAWNVATELVEYD